MEECVRQLAPHVAFFVETLMKDGKLGVDENTARIADVNTGWASTYSSYLALQQLALYLTNDSGHGGCVFLAAELR